jgi:membrane protein implicated in regulation of membrane protease activity
MLTAYLLALSFGAVLLGAGLLLGGGDHDADAHVDHDFHIEHDFHVDPDFDVDVDVDVDMDADVDHDAAAHGAHDAAHLAGDAAQGILFNPLLSIRFWTYFSATFGGLGTLLHFTGVSPGVHAPLSVVVGFITGYSVALLFRGLRQNSVSSDTSAASMVGSEARVLLAIPGGGTGKVRIRAGGQDYDLLATSDADAPIARNSTVLVVSLRSGVAHVESLPSSGQGASGRQAAPSQPLQVGDRRTGVRQRK